MVEPDLVGLIAAGERAAFRGAPGQGVASLQRAAARARETGDPVAEALARWLLGVCLNATGQYGSALTELTNACAEPGAPTEMRSLSAAAVGALFRGLARHDRAREWDRAAMQIASGSPDAQFDAWVGLASDAVGLGDSDQAFVAIAQAEPILAGQPLWWRQRIRLDWVRAEVSLMRGDTTAARLAGQRAVDAAEAAGAPRHVAKGLLLTGMAAAQAGSTGLAGESLTRAAALAEGLGALPLVWPARAVLGALLASSDPQGAQRHMDGARAAIRHIADDLPAELASQWLARSEIMAILD